MAADSRSEFDLSGNIDAVLSHSSKAGGLSNVPLSASAAKEWISNRRQAVRPWSEFLNSSRFQKPSSVAVLGKRAIKNLDYFLSNYLFVFMGLIVFCILTSPMLLIALGAVAGACYTVSMRSQSQPLRIMGRELNLSQQYAAIGVTAFPLLWISGAGSAVFWILGASFCLIMLHSAFYKPADEGSGFDVEMDSIAVS